MFKFKIEANNMSVRAGLIKEAGESIPTPLRVLNSKELEHGNNIAKSGLVKIRFPHSVFEITKYLKPSTLIGITQNGEGSAGLQKQLQHISESAGQRRTLFHPVIDRKFEITDRVNAALIALQIGLDIDTVAILDKHNSKPEQFESRLSSSINQIEKEGSPKEPMPIIRMDTDDRLFNEKLRIVLDKNIKIVNLAYASVVKNFRNYVNIIQTLNDKDIWIHMSELRRPLYRKSALMHVMPLFGIDTYALNSRPFPFGLIEKKAVVAKRFDAKSLGFLQVNEYKSKYGTDLNCDCFVDKDRDLKSFLETFDTAELLKPALVCHESVSSLKEFQISRRRILEHEYKAYLKSKEHMLVPMKRLFKIDLKQKSLSESI